MDGDEGAQLDGQTDIQECKFASNSNLNQIIISYNFRTFNPKQVRWTKNDSSFKKNQSCSLISKTREKVFIFHNNIHTLLCSNAAKFALVTLLKGGCHTADTRCTNANTARTPSAIACLVEKYVSAAIWRISATLLFISGVHEILRTADLRRNVIRKSSARV